MRDHSVQVTGPSPTTPTLDPADITAAPPPAVGGLEQSIAEASLMLEEAADRSRTGDRASRRLARQSQRAGLERKRDAARLQLIGTVLESAGKAAASTTSGTSAEGLGEVTEALAKAGKVATDWMAQDAELDAEGHSIAADAHREMADVERDATERSTRFADRAQQHLEEIARAKHEAMMAALRG